MNHSDNLIAALHMLAIHLVMDVPDARTVFVTLHRYGMASVITDGRGIRPGFRRYRITASGMRVNESYERRGYF